MIPYFDQLSKLYQELDEEEIEVVIDVLANAHRIFTFGNGGSASTASHFACDLSKRTGKQAICLNDSIALTTAWANDNGFGTIFVGQLHVFSPCAHDAVVGISCSGQSENVLKTIAYCNDYNVRTVGLTAKTGVLSRLAKYPIRIPNTLIERQEDIHLSICHYICIRLREVKR